MNVVELGPGQQIRLPRAPIRVRVTSTSGTTARLEAIGAVGAHRISEAELVVLPRPGNVQLSVAPRGGGLFAEGDQLGLSLRVEGGGDQVEVAASAVVSMSSARLAVLEIGTDVLARATGPQRAPEWLGTGINALRRCGIDDHDRVAPSEWSLVLDGSASMLTLAADGGLDSRLRLVCGVLYGWSNRLPEQVLRTSAGAAVDVSDGLSRDQLDLRTLLAPAPAAWSRVAPTIAQALARAGLVVLLTDGVPIDSAAVAAGLRTTKGRLVVVTTGRSRFGVDGAADPPAWQEELAGLDAIAAQPNGRVLALPSGDSALDADQVAARLAAGLVRAPARSRGVAGDAEAGGSW